MTQKVKDVPELFMELDPKTARAIRPLKMHPDVLAAGRKVADFDRELTEVREKLGGMTMPVGFGETRPKDSAVEDAALLMEGVPSIELPGAPASTEKAILRRREQALERALFLSKEELRETEHRVAFEMLQELEPTIEKYIVEVIDKLEAAGDAIGRLGLFCRFLSNRGLVASLRPGHVAVLPYEEILVAGTARLPYSLQWHLEQRRRPLGLDGGNGK